MPRRDFFKLLGSGIIIFFMPRCASDGTSWLHRRKEICQKTIMLSFMIAEDGTVSCFTGKIEMGQGIITSLAQMMADELNVPMEKIKMVMGDTDLCPWDGGTWGSLTTRHFGPSMRAAWLRQKAFFLSWHRKNLRFL